MPEITLRGMTWDHARGYDPMVATAVEWVRLHPGVTITWEKRSLQSFADRPIREMADTYDLMVIDHPHVGEVAADGNLVALDLPARGAELAALAAQSVGLSHPSYVFGERQWALAIDAATPVAAFRPDRIEAAPARWEEAKVLAARGQVGFAVVPINALMTFFGLARNMDYPVAQDPAYLMQPDHAAHVLAELREIVALVDPRCLTLDPIGVYEWMGREADGPAYLWLHQLQPRGLLPLSAGLCQCAGVWRQRSARHRAGRDRNRGFGPYAPPAGGLRLCLLDRRGRVPARDILCLGRPARKCRRLGRCRLQRRVPGFLSQHPPHAGNRLATAALQRQHAVAGRRRQDRSWLPGLDTVVIDRGTVNAESSGGNAGSLHLQLLSFDFGQKTGGRGEALLQTLPLQRDATALWQDLERDLGTSFEIVLTGGMMLAEEERHITFLRDKIAAERKMGIEVDLIDRSGIKVLAPGVSDRMIAAAWCPGEGKINPLLGTPALANAARAKGARFVEGVAIIGLTDTAPGHAVSTSAGTIRARRLILAAGGWTGALGAMLGVPLPIHGAPLQMVVTETAPPLSSCLLAHCDRHLTMKQATAGNLIIGGAWSAAANPVTGRTRILRDSLEGNLWVAERVLPGVVGLHVLRSWAAMNVDIDGAPLVGHLSGHPDCIVVAGANGYTLGPLLGRHAADAVATGRQPAGLDRFSPARLTQPA